MVAAPPGGATSSLPCSEGERLVPSSPVSNLVDQPCLKLPLSYCPSGRSNRFRLKALWKAMSGKQALVQVPLGLPLMSSRPPTPIPCRSVLRRQAPRAPGPNPWACLSSFFLPSTWLSGAQGSCHTAAASVWNKTFSILSSSLRS